MHKWILTLLTLLLIGTSQIKATQDERDFNSKHPNSRLVNRLQVSPLDNQQKLQPVSDEKLVKRHLQNVRSFVKSFLRVPNGVLSWEVGECYADHLIELIALHHMVKEGQESNVAEKLAQLEMDRETKLLTVPLVRNPKPAKTQLMNGNDALALEEKSQASQSITVKSGLSNLRTEPASLHTGVAITVQ